MPNPLDDLGLVAGDWPGDGGNGPTGAGLLAGPKTISGA